ncbi:transcriptional regulator (plasmid) [Azospirillum humicireducens]|uniref:Transcriptional regulator n=1 Tax=Azospirillum humicireducens TaxID=1226968 RepID=A0A2R4VQD0_9PROT|nr:helix-turn-helix domain-containing protein [Azospirillum humicireducens]AWB06627.1 transcriptional regulator [Azospirillum humicireducens]
MHQILSPDTFDAACPARALLTRLADKWVMLVLLALRTGPMRNGALLRRIDGLSQKMLTQTLRGLERDGLVLRTMFDVVPPHVEYQLTEGGEEIARLVDQIDRWIRDSIAGNPAAGPAA